MNCKYCGIESDTAYCTPSHKTMYFRRQRVTPEPDQAVTPVTVTPVTVTPTVTPDHEPINWADPDKDYSTIARKTQGRITVPGDPGYKGVRIGVDGQWVVRPSIDAGELMRRAYTANGMRSIGVASQAMDTRVARSHA